MSSRCRSVWLSILLLACEAAPAGDWVEYTSDNFTVYTDAPEYEVVGVLERFEIFRSLVLDLLRIRPETESERPLIVVFDRKRDFDRIRPGGNVGGFFYHSVFGPRMMVGPRSGVEETQLILFHEYVHYLMNRHSPTNYPVWYAEGLAELLGAVEIGPSRVVLGKPSEDIRRAFSYPFVEAALDDLVDVGPRGGYGAYMSSWLLVHYLLLDSHEDSPRRQQTLEYLRSYDAGEDPVDAFVASYGLTPGEMQQELVDYRRRRVWPALVLPRLEYGGKLLRRVLSPAEALYLRGDIAVELERHDAAHAYFDELEELSIDSPFAVKAMGRRAIALVHEERVAEGDALIERLLMIRPEDPDLLADIAHYAFDRFVYERENSANVDRSYLTRSIEIGTRAAEANGSDLEAIYYLGLAHELNGDLQRAVDTLLDAYEVNPSIDRLNSSLARILIKGKQYELGSYVLSRLYSASHSEERRSTLRALQQKVREGKVDLEELHGVLP